MKIIEINKYTLVKNKQGQYKIMINRVHDAINEKTFEGVGFAFNEELGQLVLSYRALGKVYLQCLLNDFPLLDYRNLEKQQVGLIQEIGRDDISYHCINDILYTEV